MKEKHHFTNLNEITDSCKLLKMLYKKLMGTFPMIVSGFLPNDQPQDY